MLFLGGEQSFSVVLEQIRVFQDHQIPRLSGYLDSPAHGIDGRHSVSHYDRIDERLDRCEPLDLPPRIHGFLAQSEVILKFHIPWYTPFQPATLYRIARLALSDWVQ